MTGFNDDIDVIQKIADFLKEIKTKAVELLPYHKMGEHKYEALNMGVKNYGVPINEQMEKYKGILTKKCQF